MRYRTSTTSLLISLFFSLFSIQISAKDRKFLQRESYLSVEDKSDFLISPDKTFTCGFYGLGGNAYWFSIWFTESADKTVVWMANPDQPVNRQGSRISFHRNGAMLLTDVDGSRVWETNTTSTDAYRAYLLDTGNLVLKNQRGKILWQSFDSPTNTLLPNQKFTKSMKLVSSMGKGSYLSGYFSFYFDNLNVLRMMYDGPDISSLYWPGPEGQVFEYGKTSYNSSRIAVLDEVGMFSSSDRTNFNASDMGSKVKRRLTLDYDGNMRLYSLMPDGSWERTWMALQQQCLVHGQCGRNGICQYTPQPKCSCPPGFVMTNTSDWQKGCKRMFNDFCSHPQPQEVKFVELHKTDYYGYDLDYTQQVSLDQCRESCLKNCLCVAFSYRLEGNGRCYTKSELFNGYNAPDFVGTIYLKVPKNFEISENAVLNTSNPLCKPEDAEVMLGSLAMYKATNSRVRWVYLNSFAFAIGAIEVIIAVLGWWFLLRKEGVPSLVEDGYRAISSQFRRFSYAELSKATNKFKEELGRGGFGSVYKGILGDQRVVAVKRLGDVIQGEEEFWAEVSTIGKINHMNLVRMWGYCSEAAHKLLVYEFVENLSLDRHLFSASFIGWAERFRVAVGMAKGLAYLHHECLEWVIHCDIKPENVLLDCNFEPKIADFGLAKLSQRGGPGSKISRVRGTKGYMAPEWALNLPITAKVDVYSYGVVILELVNGTRISNLVLEDPEDQESHLSRFVRITKRKSQLGEDSWLEDVVDPRLKGEFSRNQAATMVDIGLSCVAYDRTKRPTMDYVVQLLLECEDGKTVF